MNDLAPVYVETLAATCPRCNRQSHLQVLSAWSTGPEEVWRGADHQLDVSLLALCACGEISFLELSYRHEPGQCIYDSDPLRYRIPTFPRGEEELGRWPLPPPPAVPDHVPPSIRADAEEAAKCLAFEGYKAACVMARRALQNAAYEKGAPRGTGKTYENLVDHLRASTQMTDEDRDDALLIKGLGDDGAHPAKWDPFLDLEHVTQRDAEWALDVLWRLLKTIYTIPGEREALKDRRGTRRKRDQAANPSAGKR